MLKIILKLLAVVLVVGGGGLYYVWQQAIKLPDEYIKEIGTNKPRTPAPVLPANQITASAAVSKQKIAAPIEQAKIGQKVTVNLSDRDLNNLVVAKLATTQPTKQLPVGITSIKTNIKDGKIHAGGLVNLVQLAQNGKPGKHTAVLNKLTDKLTFLKNRDVYIGIIGTPVVEGKKIKFGEDTEIKVGNMNFTIIQLAENLGVSPAKIQQMIDLQLQQQNFNVDRVNLSNHRLSIEGAKK
jgi:flagellar basal body-associated protein FliL